MIFALSPLVGEQIALIKSLFLGKISFPEFYLSSLPYTNTLVFAGALMVIVFVSCHTGKKNDFTLVDKIWPLITVGCTFNYIVHGYLTFHILNTRLLILLIIQLCWSYHLMELFARRGGYSGVEDHRWEVVKSGMAYHPLKLLFFSLTYVSFYQPLMLVNNSLPELKLYYAVSKPLSLQDFWFLGLQVALIAFEYFCDTYVQEFYVAKTKYKKDGTLTNDYTAIDMERGFCTRGPFAFSRHANFCTEQMIWIALYIYGASLDSDFFNWTLIGPVVFYLFVCSSAGFTESISASRYPDYRIYREKVPFLLPFPSKRWTK
ncbi:uncharacterized protein V2V93DRAFT_364210 [Kockiozyma suomiensis]|uniref:uncharacterized protein n=1 Tax=Kockiozyma suomiensis TaxID=1337062 RepID=UPI00334331F3